MTDTTITTLQVDGMTCEHCVASVTEELSEVVGVDSVEVDLNPGGSSTVSVQADATVEHDQLRAAVEEAGYQLAAR